MKSVTKASERNRVVIFMSLLQFRSEFPLPLPCGVLQHMLVGDVTGGNNMACLMEVSTAMLTTD